MALRDTRRARQILASAALVALSAASPAWAQSSWDGGTNGTGTSWSTAANWSPDGVPTNAAATTVLFDNANTGVFVGGGTAASSTLSLGTSPTVGLITFSNANSRLSTNTNIDANGSGGTTARTITVHQGITLSNPTSNFSVTFRGSNPSLGYVLGNNNTFTTAAGTSLIFNSTVPISGAFSITTAGSGLVRFNGSNTFSGGLVVSGSSVVELGNSSAASAGAIATGAAGTGMMTLSGGTIRSTSTGSRTILNSVTASGSITMGDTVNTGALTFSTNNLTGSLPVFNLAAATTLNLLSDVTISTGFSGAGRLTKTGAGTLTLSNASTNTGGMQIDGGLVATSTISSVSTTSGGFVANQLGIANGGTWSYTSTTTTASMGSSVGTTIGTGGGTVRVANTNTTLTFAGAVTGPGRLSKTGSGTVSYTSLSSSLTGGVSVLEGQANLASTSIFLSTPGGATIADQLFVANGAALAYTNTVSVATVTSNVGLTVGVGGGIFSIANLGTTMNFAGIISGSGRLTKAGPGTLNMTSDPTDSVVTGGINLVGGTFATARLSHLGAVPSSPVADYLRIDSATLSWTDSSAVVSASVNRGMTLGPAGGTLNIVNSSATLVFNGNVAGEASTSSLTKNGAGGLRFNGTVAYAGATTVNGGTLRINGVHTNAGNYAVAPGATLGGAGTIALASGGELAVGGNLSPGGSASAIGSLVVTGNVDLYNGSDLGTLLVDIDALAASPTDVLSLSGQLDLTGSSLSLNLINAPDGSQLPLVFVSYGSLVGTFANTVNVPTGMTLDYNYNGLGQIALVAIPEPSSLGVLGLASLGLARPSRRRRTHA